jgi:hypothetical protein
MIDVIFKLNKPSSAALTMTVFLAADGQDICAVVL